MIGTYARFKYQRGDSPNAKGHITNGSKSSRRNMEQYDTHKQGISWYGLDIFIRTAISSILTIIVSWVTYTSSTCRINKFYIIVMIIIVTFIVLVATSIKHYDDDKTVWYK